MLRLIIVALLFVPFTSSSQECDRVLFTGKVIDSLRPQAFYNLMVVNRSNGRGVFGQPNGSFSVYVNNGDTIALSVKDYPLYIVMVEADSNCQCKRTIYIEGRPQEVTEVVVRPLKTLDQIKEERAALAMRETRMVTGIQLFKVQLQHCIRPFQKLNETNVGLPSRSTRMISVW